nr:L,D-transpeptidase [uncultured Gellertiella sp.]
MLKKSICLLLGLSGLLAVPAEAASRRYQEQKPILLSPDLTAPWVVQLGGGVNPVVYSSKRVINRAQAFQQAGGQQAGAQQVAFSNARPVPVQPVKSRPRGLFGLAAQPVVQPVAFQPQRVSHPIDPIYLPQMVHYETTERPGTIVIDTNNRFLYLVTGNGEARRYGVGVGKPGFEWRGVHKIARKQEWPEWNPPSEMRTREAAKGHILPVSMEGGQDNPLGARAMYLGSTLYRIHGTNAPWTIGFAVSSGCIRLRNEDVVDLYERVKVGTRVIVL